MSAKSQQDRVLEMLRCRGARGLTAYDFSGPTVIDGKDRITRVAARIGELKARGYEITDGGRRRGHKVYVLQGCGVGPSVSSVGADAADTGALFDTDPLKRRPLGAYGTAA